MIIKVTRDGSEQEVNYSEATVQEIQAHFDSQIADARKSEKDKVYSTINSLKAEKQNLSTQLKELNNKLAMQTTNISQTPQGTPLPVNEPQSPVQQAAATNSLPQTEQNQTNPNTVPSNLVQEIISKMNETVVNPLKQRINELEKQVSTTQQETVADYRQRRISELGDSIVPEIVTGSTREEIENSITKAKEVRAKYSAPTPPAAQNTPPAGGNVDTNTPPAGGGSPSPTPQTNFVDNTPTPPSPPQMPDPNNPNAVLDVSKMSHDEYVKNREKVFAQYGARPSSSGGGFR